MPRYLTADRIQPQARLPYLRQDPPSDRQAVFLSLPATFSLNEPPHTNDKALARSPPASATIAFTCASLRLYILR